MYKLFFKRFFDIFIGLIGVVVFSPFFLIVFVTLVINNNGTPFFYQNRPGLHEKIFKIIKFKTMNDKKDKNGNLLPDDKRLTKAGQFIRKTSLDELPQIINLLKGDMSIIGPRPLLPEYLPLYNDRQRKRHLVKPGISGWAQVNGRNAISWEQKFEYDVWYVENYSFFLDVKIFLLTFLKVFKSDGISKEGQETTTKFLGNA
uniref:sugar transferase n=1 Tax=uncultured Polaribacter sp. TaxID=174711 RepID=UPI002611BC0A|nr:sugar transferase [uncultured Polaribacter sp.]